MKCGRFADILTKGGGIPYCMKHALKLIFEDIEIFDKSEEEKKNCLENYTENLKRNISNVVDLTFSIRENQSLIRNQNIENFKKPLHLIWSA